MNKKAGAQEGSEQKAVDGMEAEGPQPLSPDSSIEIPLAIFLKRDSSRDFKCSLDLTLMPWLITEL